MYLDMNVTFSYKEVFDLYCSSFSWIMTEHISFNIRYFLYDKMDDAKLSIKCINARRNKIYACPIFTKEHMATVVIEIVSNWPSYKKDRSKEESH